MPIMPPFTLLIMLERWKKVLDKHDIAGALLPDLSKAFDSINHDLLIANLGPYGFDFSSLNLTASSISCRKQRLFYLIGNFYQIK